LDMLQMLGPTIAVTIALCRQLLNVLNRDDERPPD
jgi:hypothetical protein